MKIKLAVKLSGLFLCLLTVCHCGGGGGGGSAPATVTPTAAAPVVTTTAISSLTAATAAAGGSILSGGGTTITARGVCWGTSANPTIAGNRTADGTGAGSFTSALTGLAANTTYHIRAYATYSAGTAYGEDITFTTYSSSAMQLTQYGITWTFDKTYPYGQFATGDYWVVGPVTIIGISPKSEEISGVTSLAGFSAGSATGATLRTMNGSMLNPPLTHPGMTPYPSADSVVQGYDSEMYAWAPDVGRIYTAWYRASLNVALNVSAANPLALPAGSSLLSSISLPNGGRPQLSDIAVLTVLDAAPPAGSFRPPYAGTDKTVKYNVSQINYGILKSLDFSSITSDPSAVASVSALCAMLKRPWVDHYIHHGDGTQFSSPRNNMPTYGREYSKTIGEASLLLMMYDNQLYSRYGIHKSDIAIGLIQIAIDTYQILKMGGCWFENGGLNHGRKWGIILGGLLLGDSDMTNVKGFAFTPQNLLGGYYPQTLPFAEDATVFYVSSWHVDQTHVAYWGDTTHSPYIGPDQRDDSFVPYTAADIGLPEWGILNQTNPSCNNNIWNTAYRTCCNGNAWAGIALSILMLDHTSNTKTLWNNNAFFDYMDRFMAAETKHSWTRTWTRFTEDSWDHFRGSYGNCYAGMALNVRQYGNCATAGVVK